MDLVTVYDCLGTSEPLVTPPPGVLMAGYATGTGAVPWTQAQFERHPDAIRIDQWPTATDAGKTADWIDVENGAVAVADVPQRLIDARDAWQHGERPGQRWPAVYVERSEVTPVANALISYGIVKDVPLILSEPMPEHAAIETLTTAGGPFPVVGVQYQFGDLFDVSIVSAAWLGNVSKAAPAQAPGPGTQAGWKFCMKCQGLFYGPGQARSVCPRGGQHDGSQSHDFTLGFDR